MISFELDFGGPGSFFIFSDRFINGADGNYERFAARYQAALKTAHLNSSTFYKRCDGRFEKAENSASIVLFTDWEPEGWQQLIDMAKTCRASKSFEFSDDRNAD